VLCGVPLEGKNCGRVVAREVVWRLTRFESRCGVRNCGCATAKRTKPENWRGRVSRKTIWVKTRLLAPSRCSTKKVARLSPQSKVGADSSEVAPPRGERGNERAIPLGDETIRLEDSEAGNATNGVFTKVVGRKIRTSGRQDEWERKK